MKNTLLLLIATMLASPSAQATICRSKDANGVIQYKVCASEQVPIGQTVVVINTQPVSQKQSLDRLKSMQHMVEAFHDDRMAREEAKADKKKARAAEKKLDRFCKLQKIELDELLDGNFRYYEYDEEISKRRFLTSEEVDELRDEKLTHIKKNCGQKYLPDPEQLSKI